MMPCPPNVSRKKLDAEESKSTIKRVPVKNWASRSVEDYELIDVIGKGTFGKVFKAKLKNPTNEKEANEIVALKKLNFCKEEEGFPITALREIQILRRLSHQNVVTFKDIVVDRCKRGVLNHIAQQPRHKSDVYIVFEYMAHDLHGLLDKRIDFTPPQIKSLMKQLISGVKYIHDQGVMHRDIKGANLLLSNKGELKLTDFGLARLTNPTHSRYTNRVVTLWYRAPELLLGSDHYTPSIDIWSVG